MAKRCTPARVRSEIVPSSIVGHQHDDVGPLTAGSLGIGYGYASHNENPGNKRAKRHFPYAYPRIHFFPCLLPISVRYAGMDSVQRMSRR
jgi:hypothetical protein